MSTCPAMTTAAGTPVADNQNSQTAGPRGPVLMQDYQLMEKMAHFNRERVPERVVHAKGAGAYGTLTIAGDISRCTRARLFAKVGNTCEMFARFSTVAGEMGSADTARDPRGFALKFYTEEGNWHMVGNNTPVFFVRDPLKFSDFIHSQKRDPATGLRDNTMQWDFWSLSPESLHQVTTLLSDIGIMELNRNLQNYFAEVEQAAFEPGNMPPGMGASPDKMLQARLLSYPDAHRYRIGINYAALPVNKPRCPVNTYHRDGQTRFDGNGGGTVNYEPNSIGGPVDDPSAKEPPLKIHGDAGRYSHRDGNEDYRQAGDLYRLMDASQKSQLISNLAGALKTVPRFIQLRRIDHFHKADPDYGSRVAGQRGISLDEINGKAA